VYIIEGDSLPVQIIETKRLTEADSLWIRDLRAGVGVKEIERILSERDRLEQEIPLGAFIHWFGRINYDDFMEVFQMKYGKDPWVEYAREIGVLPIFEQLGADKKALTIAQRLAQMGMSPDKIAQATDLTIDEVKNLYPKPRKRAVKEKA
jgi:hypothetical protein